MHRKFGLTRIIPYYRLDGKILYAEEDIEIFLQSNYRPKFD